MGKWGVLLVGALLAVMLWPTAGAATDDTVPPTTTVVAEQEAPVTTVADPAVPPSTVPDTTVPATTVPPPPPPAASPDPGAPGRTLTVTPNTGLVHDQVVVVRGTGWPPGALTGIAQCREGTTTVSGCGAISYVDVGPRGGFREDLPVDVLLETEEGTVDCRLETCLIGANNSLAAAGAEFVNLTFDPAGPDPVRRSVTVDPTTNLIDGQVVTVTGDDFGPSGPSFEGRAELAQCRLPAASWTDCDPDTTEVVLIDTAGHLDTTFAVEAILYLPDGTPHDCRTGGCVLTVRDYYDENLSEGAQVPLAFDPLGPLLPPPTLVVDPAVGLVDGQALEVSGEGWQPDESVYMLFCRSGATGAAECSFDDFLIASTDATGTLRLDAHARTILHTQGSGRVDCRVDACALVATQSESFARSVQAPLGFDPAGALLHVAIEVTPTTGLTDGDTVHVQGDGGRPDDGVVAVQCLASATQIAHCDLNTSAVFETPGAEASGRGGSRIGAFEGDFVVHRHLGLGDSRTVDCALQACALVVAETINLLNADRAVLRFGLVAGAVDPIGATPPFAG